MTARFATRAVKVLIAEEGASVRQLLSTTLRSLGFLEITVVANCQDVFNALEHDDWDWIVMPSFIRQQVNVLHVLKAICEEPRLRNTFVSVMIDKEDEEHLPAAFHYGLLSWHKKSYVQDHVMSEFSRLLETMKSNNWIAPLIAADYFRLYMGATQKFTQLLDVERDLLRLYPGTLSLLLKHGETQLKSGAIKDGLSTLQQVCLIDEGAKRIVDVLAEKHTQVKVTSNQIPSSQQDFLGVKTCVLIDSDSTVLGALTKLLTRAGITRIEAFDNGNAAWKWLSSNPEPDLILQEWRVPGLPGPLLLQRTRHLGFNNVPIVVISSVINPEESHLLREMGVATVIAKPFSQQTFFKSLVWSLQQHACPTEQGALQNRIKQLLMSGRLEDAEQLKSVFLKDSRVRTSCKKAVEAQFAYAHGDYRQARDLAIEALKLQGDSLCLLNLIGKCLLKLGDNLAAMKVFEKAHSLSQMNVDTLCQLAIAQYDAGKVAESEATLRRAKTIDQGCELIGETECQIALLKGDTSKAKDLMEELSSIKSVIAYMNNRAVSLTRSGRFDDGIKLYHRTAESLPSKYSDTKAAVSYNLGLAYAKYGELKSAADQLKDITSYTSTQIGRKATSLLRRVKDAIDHNNTISFYEVGPDEDGAGAEADEEKKVIEAIAGEDRFNLCLHGIYKLEDTEQQQWVGLLQNQPRFVDRRRMLA